MPDEKFMRMAIEKCREGILAGQTPFGACIVKDDQVIALSHNCVWHDTDITAHAEIVAIRQACENANDIDLSDCVIYSTCEPCPMCFSACHWARIPLIISGARIEDAARAGFNELTLSNQKIKELGGSDTAIISDFMREECAALFDVWLAHPDSRAY